MTTAVCDPGPEKGHQGGSWEEICVRLALDYFISLVLMVHFLVLIIVAVVLIRCHHLGRLGEGYTGVLCTGFGTFCKCGNSK